MLKRSVPLELKVFSVFFSLLKANHQALQDIFNKK